MWLAAPLNVAGVGVPVLTVGLVPFTGTLLTIKDGQGVDSTGAAERVIIFGGAAEGQEVPQGAETVETGVEDCSAVSMGPLYYPEDVSGALEAIYLGIGADSDENESQSCSEELHCIDGYLRRGKIGVATNMERVYA